MKPRPLTAKQRAAVLLMAARGVVLRGGRGDWGPRGEIAPRTMNTLVEREIAELSGGGAQRGRTAGGIETFSYREHHEAKLTPAGEATAAQLALAE